MLTGRRTISYLRTELFCGSFESGTTTHLPLSSAKSPDTIRNCIFRQLEAVFCWTSRTADASMRQNGVWLNTF